MPDDVFAALRVGGAEAPQPPAPPQEPASADPADVFAALRIPGTNEGPPIRSPRAPNTLGEEFQAGLGAGIDSVQGSLYGVAALTGRELGIGWMEDAGMEGAARNFREAGESGRQSGGFTDIESAGGFFKWASASLGEAIPSLGLAMAGGGIGGIVGRKAVELGVKKSLARSVERRLSKFGFDKAESLQSAREYMLSSNGQKALARAISGRRSGKIIADAKKTATGLGVAGGAWGVSSAHMTGAIDQELLRSGVADPGLTALIGGIAAGALEAVPALRLLDKMFPGVDQQVSKQFVKDFAVSAGIQAGLEGTTEAAQEVITLAALAYEDPTFDMFSPDARRRVVDAFAAGALVGAVTGGAAEGVGAVKRGAFRGAKAVPPTFKAWSMTVGDKIVLPAGFVAADNTVFQEVRDRIYSAVQPQVESVVNGLQAQVQKVTDSLNENLEGGVNAESATIAEIAKAAHNQFLKEHGGQIEQAKAYMNRQAEYIARTAKDMKDPDERAKFIEAHITATKEKLAGWLDQFRRKAAERDKAVGAEVDNMEFGIEIEPGETEAAPTMTFGLNQKTPTVGVSGEETVVGYKTRESAELGRDTLQQKFPEAGEDAFRIEQQEDGTYVIQALDPTMRDDFNFWRDFDDVRKSAKRPANKRRVVLKGVDGRKFGYKFEDLALDVETMAHKGKNIDPQADTQMDGFRAFAGELLSRGVINNEQFAALEVAAVKVLDQSKAAKAKAAKRSKITGRNEPTKFGNRGFAMKMMIQFKEQLKAKDINVPFELFAVKKNDDGTYSFGFNQKKASVVRAFRAKDPKQFARVVEDLKNLRRSEQLDTAARKTGELDVVALDQDFPASNIDEPGISGPVAVSRLGDDAGLARISTTETIDEGSARPPVTPVKQSQRTELNILTGEIEMVTEKGQRDTDPQADDRATDPKNLPSEFQDRAEELARTSGRENAKELSAHDQKLLKRWARPGTVKILLGMDFASDGALTAAIKGLTNFVTKTLGLSNQITVMDDTGLRLLIEQGAVSDPVFEQTLNDPSVHARNIRIHDNSFIYLSPKILSDPVATTLALSHELGHHLYRVAWDKLTPAAQGKLRAASNTETDAEFNEWMADQLAAWIATPRAPKGAVQAFFAKVGGQIRRLYDFVKGNERFQLDETFKQFADAVALKARTTADATGNPFDAAILKSWFRNEGVTMYEWFGQTLEQDNMDFKPLTAESKKALARIEKNYPAVVQRAIVLRNWIVAAYKMAAAPSTSVVREIGQRIKSANKIAEIFHRGKMGEAKGEQNYHQAVELMRGQFQDMRADIEAGIAKIIEARRPGIKNAELQTLINERMRELAESLQQKDGDPNATFSSQELEVRAMFDAMHKYAKEAGLPVRKVTNYFPRSFNKEKLGQDKNKILDHLVESYMAVGRFKTEQLARQEARHVYNSLIDPNAQDGRATQDATETPGFKAMNSRTVQGKFFDQYLDNNMQGIVANYINAVVKRAEFNRRLGSPYKAGDTDANVAIKQGLWDPKGKMHKLLAAAKKEGATDEDLVILEKYIDANLGQLGRDDIKPGVRKFMAGVIAYQNLRVLMFTVFASLPDSVGPAIRSGDMKLTWNALKNNLHEIARTDSDLAKMARTLGIVQDSISEHIMTEYVDNHYMPAKLQKWNQAFFKWTGLNYYTDMTRKYALAVGIDYLQQSYEDSLSSDSKVAARGKDMLAELGVTPAQIKSWLANGKPTYDSQSHDMDGAERKVAEALVQFVDESIMRPNAAQRPILASDPRAMVVYHLKNYMYSIHDIILKRIKFNIDESESPAQYVAAILPALGMMLATAVGLELRELIQYAGSNRKPPTDRMDGWEYTWELAQRSGLTGYAQIGIDLEGAEDRGMSHVAGIGGPAISQAADILSRPSTQTIPKAIPIIGQIPALRDAVRTVL